MDVKNIISDVDENLKNFQSAYQNLLSMRDEIKDNIAALQKSLSEVEEALGIKPAKIIDEQAVVETIKKGDNDSKKYPPLMNDVPNMDATTESIDELTEEDSSAEDIKESAAENSAKQEEKIAAVKKAPARKSPTKKTDDAPKEESGQVAEAEPLVSAADNFEDKKVDRINSKEKIQQVIDAVDDDEELLLDDDDYDDVADDIDELPF